jgi:KaiC/GvpD/RAD55 family RecA-like ATPase
VKSLVNARANAVICQGRANDVMVLYVLEESMSSAVMKQVMNLAFGEDPGEGVGEFALAGDQRLAHERDVSCV